MNRRLSVRGRPATAITMGRAARLHQFVMLLGHKPRARGEVLRELGIGLRTFYRELELLKACGIAVKPMDGSYALVTPCKDAEGRLPFPDPQLSFADALELSRSPTAAGRRLAEWLAGVVHEPDRLGRRPGSSA